MLRAHTDVTLVRTGGIVVQRLAPANLRRHRRPRAEPRRSPALRARRGSLRVLRDVRDALHACISTAAVPQRSLHFTVSYSCCGGRRVVRRRVMRFVPARCVRLPRLIR